MISCFAHPVYVIPVVIFAGLNYSCTELFLS